MNRRSAKLCQASLSNFQFPLLGISPWIDKSRTNVDGPIPLSIPITWDFSMNPRNLTEFVRLQVTHFQFPLLGISPWITYIEGCCSRWNVSFQFPLLGISPWIVKLARSLRLRKISFQFPLLGISPWINVAVGCWSVPNHVPFNSHYLGFLHESCQCPIWRYHQCYYFQFPLLGISPWIRPHSLLCSLIRGSFNHDLGYVFSIIIGT